LLLKMRNEDRTVPPVPGDLVESLRLGDGSVVPGRVYGPIASEARTVIVLGHGIHHLGINEPRLIRFASHLASLGCRVYTPELKGLTEYKITEQGIEVLRAAVEKMTTKETKVGLIGFSFAGGLALRAAEAPETSSRLKYVASIGGHHDLARTLRFLATDTVVGPDGSSSRRAHEYGLLVLLNNHLKAFRLEEEGAFREVLSAWLKEDRKTAAEKAERLSTQKAYDLYTMIKEQKLAALAPRLLPLLDQEIETMSRLSPHGSMANIKTEVILLHGANDNVVPPEETLFGSIELREKHQGSSITLVTPLLEHVRVDHPAGIGEKMKLINLISHLL
jgi:dienelactone hydrolase